MTKNIISKYSDDFGNIAEIDKGTGPAYKGGPKTTFYRVMAYASYDNDFLFHVSVYETMEEAEEALKTKLSGTYKKIA